MRAFLSQVDDTSPGALMSTNGGIIEDDGSQELFFFKKKWDFSVQNRITFVGGMKLVYAATLAFSCDFTFHLVRCRVDYQSYQV